MNLIKTWHIIYKWANQPVTKYYIFIKAIAHPMDIAHES